MRTVGALENWSIVILLLLSSISRLPTGFCQLWKSEMRVDLVYFTEACHFASLVIGLGGFLF